MRTFIQKHFSEGRGAAVIFVLIVLAAGIFLRLWRIAEANFFLYDEGYYLNYNLRFLKLIDGHNFTGFQDFWQALHGLMRFSLATGKALWFLIVDARVFGGALREWWFPRGVSMLAGLATLGMVYLFSKRLYHSRLAAWGAAAVLAVYPSHVFYSRLAFQEALCTFFFIAGVYFYFFPRNFGWRTFVSGLLFACVYFTNYRLIIAPVFVGFIELFMSLTLRERPDVRKLVWHSLVFAAAIVLVGNMEGGLNTYTTFSWIFYQANMAHGTFEWYNLLSYPYYLFRLDSFFAGALFFANIYFLIKRQWPKAFPFALVIVMMVVFSLPFEKGARYLCIGLPFVALAISLLMVELWEKGKKARTVSGLIALLLFSTMFFKSFALATAQSDYESSAKFILRLDPKAGFISTQPHVQNLFTPSRSQVSPFRPDFAKMVQAYASGYRFLVIDPQAYVSFTESGKRFDTELVNYADFIVKHIRPLKTFPHFNDAVLERFVFEHNENLLQSMRFLSEKDKGFGALRVYDIATCLEAIARLSGAGGR